MTTKDITIETAKYVEVTEIVPECWEDWFFGYLSENAPFFSWGGNNRTLVDAGRFKDHALNVLDMVGSIREGESISNEIKEHREAFLDTLSYLEAEQIYIDMEA